MIISPGSGVLFMKVGVHAREDLDSIIERKSKEIDDAGFALWGYGGATCHPTSMVQPFASQMVSKGLPIYLCMQEINSNHFSEPVRAEKYSIDGNSWHTIHRSINVVGSRYALAIKALRREELYLPLSKTKVAVGPSRGRVGSLYVQGRADKACLELDISAGDMPSPEEKNIQISLVAELIDPYAVFLK